MSQFLLTLAGLSLGGGIAVLVLALTVGFQYLSVYLGGAKAQSATQEIMYSEFMDLVEEGKAEQVILQDGTLEITLKEGAAYTDADGNTYDNSVTLFTEDMGDSNLIPWQEACRAAGATPRRRGPPLNSGSAAPSRRGRIPASRNRIRPRSGKPNRTRCPP